MGVSGQRHAPVDLPPGKETRNSLYRTHTRQNTSFVSVKSSKTINQFRVGEVIKNDKHTNTANLHARTNSRI